MSLWEECARNMVPGGSDSTKHKVAEQKGYAIFTLLPGKLKYLTESYFALFWVIRTLLSLLLTLPTTMETDIQIEVCEENCEDVCSAHILGAGEMSQFLFKWKLSPIQQ